MGNPLGPLYISCKGRSRPNKRCTLRSGASHRKQTKTVYNQNNAWAHFDIKLIRHLPENVKCKKQKLSTILRFYKEVMYKTINLALKYLPINIKTTLV